MENEAFKRKAEDITISLSRALLDIDNEESRKIIILKHIEMLDELIKTQVKK